MILIKNVSKPDNENTAGIFLIDKSTGNLSIVGHQSTYGEDPRSFVLSPSGKFLIVANLFSYTIVLFQRDQTTGLLQKTGDIFKVKSPASLKIIQYPKIIK